jgi:hypothetical protein
MPLIQVDSDPTTRLALSKLLGAVIATTPGAKDQIHLFQQVSRSRTYQWTCSVLTRTSSSSP